MPTRKDFHRIGSTENELAMKNAIHNSKKKKKVKKNSKKKNLRIYLTKQEI